MHMEDAPDAEKALCSMTEIDRLIDSIDHDLTYDLNCILELILDLTDSPYGFIGRLSNACETVHCRMIPMAIMLQRRLITHVQNDTGGQLLFFHPEDVFYRAISECTVQILRRPGPILLRHNFIPADFDLGARDLMVIPTSRSGVTRGLVGLAVPENFSADEFRYETEALLKQCDALVEAGSVAIAMTA